MEKIIVQPGLYPVVVRQSRYSGIYEGGIWFAMPSHEELDLTEPYIDYLHGDDCDAVDFWDSDIAKTFGVGDTPDEAVLDLINRHNASSKNEPANPPYLDIRGKFESEIDERKASLLRQLYIYSHSKVPPEISQIHVERTSYFGTSSGYKQDEKL